MAKSKILERFDEQKYANVSPMVRIRQNPSFRVVFLSDWVLRRLKAVHQLLVYRLQAAGYKSRTPKLRRWGRAQAVLVNLWDSIAELPTDAKSAVQWILSLLHSICI
jgi:hypothetical protein